MVLLIESDPQLLRRMAKAIEADADSVDGALDTDRALNLLHDHVFDVVVAEVRSPGNVVDLLHKVRRDHNETAVVIATCPSDSMAEAIDAVPQGLYDVIRRPFSLEELKLRVHRAIEVKRLGQETRSLRGERDLIYRTSDFIAESPAIRQVLATVNKVASTDATVLLTGETGTGKELIAAAIHYGSNRADNAFVRVNCAALPEELLESELFGHEKGAFTGAQSQRIGRFELADGGSIFLDEIGDMSMHTQAKVLRVLQEREFERVGSSATRKVNVRVIAATNRDLGEEVRQRNFREDLYYRLNVIHIHLPPLRERGEDIVPLSRFFVRKIGAELKRGGRRLSAEAEEKLRSHDWPGNVRELRNTIERALILGDGPIIDSDDLEIHDQHFSVPASNDTSESPSGLERAERAVVIRALEESDWVQKDAASRLGISRRALNYRIRKLGIRHPKWRANK